jgi:hypothetical protein
MADDVWLFWMGRRAGSTIRRVGSRYALVPWPGCHEQGLWVNENANGENDRVITALTARYGSPFGQGLQQTWAGDAQPFSAFRPLV